MGHGESPNHHGNITIFLTRKSGNMTNHSGHIIRITKKIWKCPYSHGGTPYQRWLLEISWTIPEVAPVRGPSIPTVGDHPVQLMKLSQPGGCEPSYIPPAPGYLKMGFHQGFSWKFPGIFIGVSWVSMGVSMGVDGITWPFANWSFLNIPTFAKCYSSGLVEGFFMAMAIRKTQL